MDKQCFTSIEIHSNHVDCHLHWAALQRLKAETDLLKAALRWCASQIEFEDDGEFGAVEIPPQFAAVIAEASA